MAVMTSSANSSGLFDVGGVQGAQWPADQLTGTITEHGVEFLVRIDDGGISRPDEADPLGHVRGDLGLKLQRPGLFRLSAISRAIAAAPTTWAAVSLIGETLTETSI